ncbi:MAG: hypothetical protein QXI84_09210 [Thermofilaceae archaeon]
MKRKVGDVLGISATALRRYGVLPDDDIDDAIEKLRAAAPHLAELLRNIELRLSYN